MEGERFSDKEIIVLAYCALKKGNFRDLGFGSTAEVYRKLSSLTSRGIGSLKLKHDNIVSEFYRADVQNERKGTSGVPTGSKVQRWTERDRWESYLELPIDVWKGIAKNVLEVNEPTRGLPKESEPLGPEGYVYAITNPAFPGWVKVGQSHEPDRRLASYWTADPYRDYQMPFRKRFQDRKNAEKKVHDALKNITSDWNGEWFRLNLETVMETIIQSSDD